MQLCHEPFCVCTAVGCVANDESDVTFDVAVTGDTAVGTILLPRSYVLHLTRT